MSATSVTKFYVRRPISVRERMTMMTKTLLPDDGRRAITTASSADERHQHDAQAPFASSLIAAAMSLVQ